MDRESSRKAVTVSGGWAQTPDPQGTEMSARAVSIPQFTTAWKKGSFWVPLVIKTVFNGCGVSAFRRMKNFLKYHLRPLLWELPTQFHDIVCRRGSDHVA